MQPSHVPTAKGSFFDGSTEGPVIADDTWKDESNPVSMKTSSSSKSVSIRTGTVIMLAGSVLSSLF